MVVDMQFNNLRFFVIFFFGFLPSLALGESLNSTLIDAYRNSNLLTQSRALLKNSGEDVVIALSALGPQVTSQASVSKSESAAIDSTVAASASLTASLLLYDAGNKGSVILAKNETALATWHALKSKEQSVFLDAITSRLAIQRDTEILLLRSKNEALIAQELQAALDRFEVGEVTRTEVAQAEARLAQSNSALVEAVGNLAISKELFYLVVGRPPSPKLDRLIAFPKLPITLKEAISFGQTNHPDILEARHLFRASEYNVEAARASMGPEVSAGATLGDSNAKAVSGTLSLKLVIPLYNHGRLNSLLRKSVSSLQSSRVNLDQKLLVVKKNISANWSELNMSRAQLSANERQIEAAEIAFMGTREEAKFGAKTTLDVLDAEQVLLDARTSRVIFETRSQAALYTLLGSLGKLSVKSLNLSIPEYDVFKSYEGVKRAPLYYSKRGAKLDKIIKRFQGN